MPTGKIRSFALSKRRTEGRLRKKGFTKCNDAGGIFSKGVLEGPRIFQPGKTGASRWKRGEGKRPTVRNELQQGGENAVGRESRHQ